MRKHWFLMVVVGTLISFSACKKEEENMIIGKWEVISIESDIADIRWIPCVYEFYNSNRFSCKSKEGIRIENGKYFIKNDTITFETTYHYSMKISFLDSKTMIWKDEDGGFKAKSTLQKIK